MATNHSCDSSVAIVQATRNSECVESIETSTHRWRRSDPAPVGRSVCVPHRIRDVRLCGALTLNARSGRERLGPTRAGGGDRDVDSATRGRAACGGRGSVRGPVTRSGEGSPTSASLVRRRAAGDACRCYYIILNTHTSNLSDSRIRIVTAAPYVDLINYTRDRSGG